MDRRTKWLAVLGILLVGGVIAFLGQLAARSDRQANEIWNSRPFPVSAAARHFHSTLAVVDLHADTLLWPRDILRRNSVGHVDLPRLAEGRVCLQVFSAVSKIPWKPLTGTPPRFIDPLAFLAMSERWPPGTWFSPLHRALHQAARLERFEQDSHGRLMIVRNKRDLERLSRGRAADPTLVGGLLAVEGAQALEGKVQNVDALFAAGFRVMSPSHFYDSDISGSSYGIGKIGLTEKGRQVVARMEELGMIVDLAHASTQTFSDVIALARQPVLVSHTGVTAVCNKPRNLTDDQIRAVAKTGGIIGIGYWKDAVCSRDLRDVARSIRHVVDVAGVPYAALGSDFDGGISEPMDAAGLAQLTEALLQEGFTRPEIEQIMGGNALRFFRQFLPD